MGYKLIGVLDCCYDAISVHLFQIREEDQRQESLRKCMTSSPIRDVLAYIVDYPHLTLHLLISIDDLACIARISILERGWEQHNEVLHFSCMLILIHHSIGV